jgi:hypothetical protein
MSMKIGRRMFRGVVLASLALAGCGVEGEQEMVPEAVEQQGVTGEVEQGVSVIAGYDISLRSSATHTLTGFVMPRWTAPAGHSAYDWLALARVGSPVTEYISWVYVGSTDTYGLLPVYLPNSLDTTQQYEVRYFKNDDTLAARTPAFNVQALPVVACPRSEGGGELPEAHAVTLGKTSGSVTFSYTGNGGEYPDRFLVYQGGSVLFDSGCTDGSGSTTIAYNNTLGRLRVVVQPSCAYAGPVGTGWSWNMSCGQ